MDGEDDFEVDENDILPDISAAKLAVLPQKSRERYGRVYEAFCEWRKTKKNASNVSMEDVTMAYFYDKVSSMLCWYAVLIHMQCRCCYHLYGRTAQMALCVLMLVL